MDTTLDWKYESMYFGSAFYPDGMEWRYSGSTYQYQEYLWTDTPEDAAEIAMRLEDDLEAYDVRISFKYNKPLVTYWRQPEDGLAMKWYLADKAMAWT